ncbi:MULTISPECIES: DUF5695 domain-containing protein [Bacteroides]|jgi:hypothetical protein|uniref:DUF5695 domain-containing protein n=1 Tax=Bacteroides zhangwenhongii TaxID=2650157 RepID=A0ABT5H4Z0_9BACE|nr:MULTISPECIES: DUF5695 domain-containing protein [Bacteroides]MDC7135656.1 DUF5695 domain-containing protein [Bacteroides zhangwenhongii]GLL54007.1 hypothetical protein KUBF_16690 [Bacteroides finegoldii]
MKKKKVKRKLLKLCSLGLLGITVCTPVIAQQINYQANPRTGALQALTIAGDPQGMNWLVATDGSQYSWIKENYGWGLGYFTQIKGNRQDEVHWNVPVEIRQGGKEIIYFAGDIRILVKRYMRDEDLVEEYIFRNLGNEHISLADIGIYTPFNDNYPNSQTCINARTNTHIWEGDNAAYVNALRMGGYAPHLGLVVTKGAVKSYEIWERGNDKANSHTRGIIALNLPDIQLEPGKEYSISWRLFSHKGIDDFQQKVLEKGSVFVSCNKYVFEKGETARIELAGASGVQKCIVKKNSSITPMYKEGDKWIAEIVMDQLGEVHLDISYGTNKQTHATCLVISNVDSLIQKRVDFILNHQQMKGSDRRKDAFMVYDNEKNEIYLNNTPNCNPVDRDEGAERVGMGVLLAKYYQLHPSSEIKESLLRYTKFLRNRLQESDYKTFSSVDRKGRNRAYNYAWVSELYFQMYGITKDKQYAVDGYKTLRSMFRQFGHGFYAIGIPVRLGLQMLKTAGMQTEYETLKNDYIRVGDTFVKNGLNYPASEVNYEQSIVAPSIMFLLQLYQETGIQKYLDEAKRQMSVLEAFAGNQPSYHLNEIAIRHWDGYWFGKREMWGDTFPHYWSTLSGAAFYLYAQCTGDNSYKKRAENVVRNNLCLFFEDGRASCAYIYPNRVNGMKGEFYDPYANDQDWALVYYLLVSDNIY